MAGTAGWGEDPATGVPKHQALDGTRLRHAWNQFAHILR